MASSFTAFVATCHRLAFGLRFRMRARAWPDADLRPCPGGRILVSGYFNEALGIGTAGRLIADKLESLGRPVVREDLRPSERGLLTRGAQSLPPERDAPVWLIAANPPEARIALFSRDARDWHKQYRIGMWHWESSLAPAAWADTARWFHEIWVSSAFTAGAIAEALQRAGRPEDAAKLRIRPLPVPVSVPASSDGPARPADRPVRVLTLFDPRSDFDRKNPMAAVDAWRLAFPEPARNAHLVVKTLAGAEAWPAFAGLLERTAGRPDIQIRAETLSPGETTALIAASDAVVSLHRGEGFGLPLAEAMAHGVTAIATGWSGNLQFMTPDNSILVPYRLIPASPQYNGPAAVWAEPDVGAAAQSLRDVVADAALRSRLGQAGRQAMMKAGIDWQLWGKP